MAGERYVPISREQMDDLLVTKLGFTDITAQMGTHERIYERQIVSKNSIEFPYAVRVYSSIYSGGSKRVGEDAIRVVLVDLAEENPKFRFKKVLGEGKGSKAGKRIYRTKSAMINLEARVRDYFHHVIFNQCPQCGSLMAIRNGRNGKFLGCTKWRPHNEGCSGTKNFEEMSDTRESHDCDTDTDIDLDGEAEVMALEALQDEHCMTLRELVQRAEHEGLGMDAMIIVRSWRETDIDWVESDQPATEEYVRVDGGKIIFDRGFDR